MSTMTEHVSHLVNLLMYVAQKNNANEPCESLTTPFHCAQNEPLLELVLRLHQHIRCSPSCFAAALVYIDRVTESNPDLPLNLRTVNLLFTTSLLLANQFLDDKSERALQFANVARVHPVTMANLKTDFLFRIRFSLTLSDIDIRGYSDKLQGQFSTSSFEQTGMWNGLIKIPPPAPQTSPVSTKKYPRFMPPFWPGKRGSKTITVDASKTSKRAQVPQETLPWAASHVDSIESSVHFAAMQYRNTAPNWIR